MTEVQNEEKVNAAGESGSIHECESESKPEIKMFTDPKRVVKKSFGDILLFQTAAAGMITAALLILRYFLPEVFENIYRLMERYVSV